MNYMRSAGSESIFCSSGHQIAHQPISPSAMLALVASLCIQTSIAGMSGATWWKELIRKF
jgi:hypothetical protein